MILLLLLACGGPKEPKVPCPVAQDTAAKAWGEVQGYFDRKAAMLQPEVEAAERAVVRAGDRRAAAASSRTVYQARQTGGLTDIRTGEVKRDPAGVKVNRAREQKAGERVETHADTEEDLIAIAMERRAEMEALQAKASLAAQIRDAARGTDAEAAWALASRAPQLADTELAALAQDASRKAHEVCAVPAP